MGRGCRLAATVLAAALALGTVPAAAATTREYTDFDDITSHVTTTVPQTLAIAGPAQDTTTTADGYYVTGTSDPTQPLYLNGAAVPDRGMYGSWGVFVPLYPGENTYTVKQGDSTHTVKITKSAPGETAVTNAITNMYPAVDSGYLAGKPIELSCTAPAGAVVWVLFDGTKVELVPAATAKDGVPIRYKGTVSAAGVLKMQDLGTVAYSMRYGDKTTTAASVGKLFIYPQDSQITVQIADTLTTVFKDSAAKTVANVVRGGAIDTITNQNEAMYLLGMGSWVPKESVTLLPSGNAANTVTAGTFAKSAYGERIALTGSTNPIATTWQTDKILHIELHHTGGEIPPLALPESRLFTGITITKQGDSTILEFAIRPGEVLWGHSVEYANNITTIYCKYPPIKTGGEAKPLADIVVGLDAGHGGSDPGAFGTARLLGPVEADINYATALAVKKRLESLGATVYLTSYTANVKSTTADRTQAALAGKADFYLSLHCNSVAGNGTKPNGVETYYYFTRSKPFADILQKNILRTTGRTDRGVKNNYFRVTMNSLTPAALIEMGFGSNSKEYDQLCSKQGIFQMANAIGDSLIEAIG